MSRIALSADWHLASKVWSDIPESWGIPLKALDSFLNSVSKKKVDAIIAAGDIFDSRSPGSYAVTEAQDLINMFKHSVFNTAGNKDNIFAIYGNHDRPFKNEPSWNKCIGIKDLVLSEQIGITKVLGIPFTKDTNGLIDLLKDIKENIQDLDLLVLHSPFRHLLGFDDSWQLQRRDVEGVAPVVLVGDIHTPDIDEKEGGTTIVSPGSLYPTSIDKIGKPHGWYLWDTEDNTFEFVELPELMVVARGIEEARKQIDKNEEKLICVIAPKEHEGAVKELSSSKDVPLAFFSEASVVVQDMDIKEISSKVKKTKLADALPLVVDKKKEPEVYKRLKMDLNYG